MCSLEGEKALRERPHQYFGSHTGKPAGVTGHSHQQMSSSHQASENGSNRLELSAFWDDTKFQVSPESN
jgi:hypothetical protein